QLDPLDFAASAAIIEAGLGAGHVSVRLAQRLFERTGGNPFFLEQVCRALVEQGAVSVREGEAVVEGGPETLSLPDTVQAVIRTRKRGVKRSITAGAPPSAPAGSVSLPTRSTRSNRCSSGFRICRMTKPAVSSGPTCCSSRNARARRWGCGAGSRRSSGG